MKKILLVLLFLVTTGVNINAKNINSEYSAIIKKYVNKTLSVDNIKYAISDLKLNYPSDVFKRIIIESGNLKSKLTVKGNNLFGMRKAGSRETVALKRILYGYATYKHWIFSIIDYKLWEKQYPPKKHESYILYLKRRHWN